MAARGLREKELFLIFILSVKDKKVPPAHGYTLKLGKQALG
jgi:hypothetical protein